MKVFFRFLKEYPKESVLAPLFKLLEACFDLLVPLVVATIIDDGISNGDKPLIIRSVILLCALAVIGLVCALAAQYFAARAAVGSAAKLRSDLFAKLQTFTYSDTDKIGTSAMITRMTSDVNQLQSGVNMTLRLLLRSPIIVFGAVILAFTINVRLALIFAVMIPLLSVVIFGIILGGIPLYRKVQSRLDKVTGATRENLNGVRVIRAFCMEDDEIKSFKEVSREHATLQNIAGRLSALMNPLTYLILNLATIFLIWRGAFAVDEGLVTRGALVALINYMTQIIVELIKFADTIFLLTKSFACSKRIGDVLDMPAGCDIDREAKGLRDGESDLAVCFENASLTYSKGAEPALSDIDLKVKKGETVGIIGGTGSGKTSLVNLIPRFYDATEGEVYVFGKNVTSYDPEELRAKVGVVPQKAVLFKGTIRSNLAWGREDATDEEMWQALTDAQAADFVRAKEGGLDAPVEQNGRNFSGGQRQRLTIARALIRRPEILILDDSSSALDFVTDAALRSALKGLDYDPTVFIITQRTASIRHADKIAVMEDGRIAGVGKHDDLLEGCSVYREIHLSQFKGGADA